MRNIGNEIEGFYSNFVFALEFLTVSTAHRAASFGNVFTILSASLRNTRSPAGQGITDEPFGAHVKPRRFGVGIKVDGLSLRCNILFARAPRARCSPVLASHTAMILTISKLGTKPDRNIRYERSRLITEIDTQPVKYMIGAACPALVVAATAARNACWAMAMTGARWWRPVAGTRRRHHPPHGPRAG